MKRIVRTIRLRLNKIGSKKRNKKLKTKDISIISNNCYAGITYEYLNLPYNSPTIGLYFFAPEYIKFLKDIKKYLSLELKKIDATDSKYYKELIKLGQTNKIICQLGDIEIVFLHYNTFEEAKEKWERRCKRINFDNLIVKFNDQNLCTEKEIEEFLKLDYKNKICFLSKSNEDENCIWLKKYKNCRYVKDDIYASRKYFNIINYINKINNKNIKKKIMHLLFSSHFSGAENVACNIIKEFENDYDMYYCSPSGSINKYLTENGIKHVEMKKFSLSEIKKAIKKTNPDIIHAHDYRASCMAGIIRHNCKVISHLHNNYPFAKKWNIKTIAYTIISKKFTSIITVSKKIYEEAIFKKHIHEKTRVIYNYVNKDSILQKALEFNPKEKYDVFFIGRLTEQKDPLFFINKINEINKKKKIKAAMIGDGELKNECLKLIKEYKLEKNIEMLGFQSNPFPYIYNSKVCIMPSKWEGFGLTAIESMCLNKVVFNSGVGGLGEIFEKHPEYITFESQKIIDSLNDFDNQKKLQEVIMPYIDKKAWKEKIQNLYK